MATRYPDVSTRTVLAYLWKRFWSYPWLASVTSGAIAIAVIAQLIAPWFLKQIIDGVSTTPPTPASFKTLIQPLLFLVLVWAIERLGWIVQGWLNARFQPQVMRDLEVDGFAYLLGHSYKFFSDEFTGTLVRRIRRISRAFEQLADAFQFQFIPAALILTGSIIALGLRSTLLAGIFFLWCAAFMIIAIIGSAWKLRLDVIRAERDSKVTGVLSDAITNAVTIKLFPSVVREQALFAEAAESLRAVSTRSWRRAEIIFGSQAFMTYSVHAAFLLLGLHLWSQGVLTVGDLVLIHTYLQLVFNNLWDIGRAVRRVYEALADAKEMVEILELPYGVKDRRGAKELAVKKGQIEFKKVTFAFHKTRKVLMDFSLKIAPGEKVALVGPSGAGKTTVTKLLFRFYDVDGGKILVDGQDISGVTQDSLRQQIGLVPQEPILFHRTLRENILYGRPNASESEMLEASKKAHCHAFITDLPDGYESFVGERGVKLSGGERQRIAIARAILKDAPILVLDEATSSLDSESEHFIQEALRELMKQKTVIVIAHRLSTIMAMDRIIVVEEGRITSMGTHRELLADGGTYQRLWEIQAGGFIA